MLLLNKTLIRMARGLWGWILAITACRLLALAGTAVFSRTVSSFLGDLGSLSMTADQAGNAVLHALGAAAAVLAADLLTGEAEFRCAARARQSLRTAIFSKALELDVGNIEKIGPVSAITSSVDGVESMQVYYSKYLPGLIYCLCAPFYLFFPVKGQLISRCGDPSGGRPDPASGQQPVPEPDRGSENRLLGFHGGSHRILSGEYPGPDCPEAYQSGRTEDRHPPGKGGSFQRQDHGGYAGELYFFPVY